MILTWSVNLRIISNVNFIPPPTIIYNTVMTHNFIKTKLLGGRLSMVHLNFRGGKKRKKNTKNSWNFFPTFHILVVQEQLQENIPLPFFQHTESIGSC